MEVCPEDKPFVVNGTCQKCAYAEVYDVDNKNCSQIPEGYVFDPNTHNLVIPKDMETSPDAPNLLVVG